MKSKLVHARGDRAVSNEYKTLQGPFFVNKKK